MMIADGHLMSHTFPQSHPPSSAARAWSLLNDSTTDESAPSRTTPFPSSRHPLSTDLGSTFDPALCVTPERKSSLRVPSRHPVPVPEDDTESDHRLTKVHFDQMVSVHHLSPEYGSNSGSLDVYHQSASYSDELPSAYNELNSSDIEPISIVASDLRRLSPSLISSVDSLELGRNVQHSCSTGSKKLPGGGGSRQKKSKADSRSISQPQVVSEFGSSDGLVADFTANSRDPEATVESECVLARPEFNSTLKISNEMTDLQEQEFDFAAVAKEKIGPKLKQQVFEKACLKVNHDAMVYPDLISLEVTEADLLDKVAEEQAKHPRHTDTAAERVKPEDKLSRAPDILDFFTRDLQKESPSVNLVAIQPFEIALQTADLDRAFDLYRHIRTWDSL